MYKRLIILSIIILAALCGLIGLGYHSIWIRAQGMPGERLGEFATVAENIRRDVTRKLDEFMQAEADRLGATVLEKPIDLAQFCDLIETIAPPVV